jgi:hypothetical protein
MSKRAVRRRRGRDPSTSPRTSAPPHPRDPALADGAGQESLECLLDSPDLVRIVPRLAPEVLHRLIRHRGLDACGELVAAATPRQMASLLDLDLWQPAAPGRDDRFDAQRFGVWIEMLMGEGEVVAGRVVAAMDPSLAIAGLSRFVRVFDPGIFEPTAASDDEVPESTIGVSGGFECEVGGYVIRARTPQSWDAIAGLVTALADHRPETFHALMEGCRRLSNSTPESDGLDELMLEPEQMLHDVSLEREDRRSQQGYLTAGDARAFLQMARRPVSDGDGSRSRNPIVAAYFRALGEAAGSRGGGWDGEGIPAGSPADSVLSDPIEAVAELLAGAGNAPARPRALIGPASADAVRVTPIQPLMEYLIDADPAAYFARSQQLAFLANALLAGSGVHSRAFTTEEAWDAAVGICNLGLEAFDRHATLPDSYLVDHDAMPAFEAGWRLLHHDVSRYVVDRLIATLSDLQSVDSAIQDDLLQLRRELERHRDAPWHARESLDVIGILDMPAWACLCGLLSECPVLPEALTAVVEGHPRAVSATAFTSFSTAGQFHQVREFVARLRDVLLP